MHIPFFAIALYNQINRSIPFPNTATITAVKSQSSCPEETLCLTLHVSICLQFYIIVDYLKCRIGMKIVTNKFNNQPYLP